MSDAYRDTGDRIMNDPEFRAAMMVMVKIATAHGFTPGEMRQLAFAASVYVEEHSARPLYLSALGVER